MTAESFHSHKTASRALPFLLFQLGIAANLWIWLASAASSGDEKGNNFVPGLEAISSGRCVCTDVKPFIADSDAENGCRKQREWGKCETIPGLYAPEELPEGWCQITCGRCTCCQSPARVAFENNLTSFLWLAHHADRLRSFNSGEDLLNPGSMFTIFAPTNAAVQERLKSLGFGYLLTSPYTDPDPGAKNVLKLIVSAHISPALPVSEALWTSPFLSQGTVIQSEAKDSRGLTGAGSSAEKIHLQDDRIRNPPIKCSLQMLHLMQALQ
eukprot:jgi/Tetstr1/445602/TSEL_003408.t1